MPPSKLTEPLPVLRGVCSGSDLDADLARCQERFQCSDSALKLAQALSAYFHPCFPPRRDRRCCIAGPLPAPGAGTRAGRPHRFPILQLYCARHQSILLTRAVSARHVPAEQEVLSYISPLFSNISLQNVIYNHYLEYST